MLGQDVENRCTQCGTPFKQRHLKHKFCSRQCYSRYYRTQHKTQFPTYICPNCGKKTQLDFYPNTSKYKWSLFRCAGCDSKKDFGKEEYIKLREIKIDIQQEETEDYI